MNRRWLPMVVVMFVAHATANAQTMVAPTGYGPDPYAMQPTSTTPYLWGNGYAIPTTPSTSSLGSRLWVSADYLLWWTDGMDTPPLVTTSPDGTLVNNAGVLGLESTSILYGNDELNSGSANGMRLRSGFWFRNGFCAIEGEFFRIRNSTETYSAQGDGDPILARPYYDVLNVNDAARLISFVNVANGSVSVSSESELRSGLINLRRSLLPESMLGQNDPNCPPNRIDWIVGYRVLELRDNLVIRDSRDPLVGGGPTTINSEDSFETKNQFQGLQLGVIYKRHLQRVWMESMIRVALGNNRQRAMIRGQTEFLDTDTSTTSDGGLLAQRSNIGNFERNEFAMIPELGVNFGIRLTRCLHATVGYNVVYFANVLRAGDQLDLDVNPELIPPEAAVVTGPLRPRYLAIEDNYWAHGLNFGAELKF